LINGSSTFNFGNQFVVSPPDTTTNCSLLVVNATATAGRQPFMSYGSRFYSIFMASILASFEALQLITFINLLPFFTRQLSLLGPHGVCVMSIVAGQVFRLKVFN